MFNQNGDQVTITISKDDFVFMTLLIGVGIGGYAQTPKEIKDCLKLMDRVNEGNPEWSAYCPPDGELNGK